VESTQRQSFNWLSLSDRGAKKLPRARHWLQYTYFEFARYHHLRPLLADPLDGSQLNCLDDLSEFRRSIREWLRRIRAGQQVRDVLKDLKPRERIQLAALVADSVEGFDAVGEHRRRQGWHKELHTLATHRDQVRAAALRVAVI